MNEQKQHWTKKQFPASTDSLETYDIRSSEDLQIRQKNSSFYERRQASGPRTKNLSINIGYPYEKKFKNSKFNKSQNLTTATEFYQNYQILEKIGEGGSSVVKLCKEVKGDQTMAVKIIKYADTERVFGIIQEEKILSGLDHPNIIKNHGFYIDTTKKTCFIIMELAKGKGLSQLVLDRYPFTTVNMYEVQEDEGIFFKPKINIIIRTVNYMHLNHICHRDITPDNVIYDQQTKQIKLIDFSISKDLGNCFINSKMYSQNGNIAFMSPEVLLGKVYDKSVDIWGIGITILSTLLGHNPFVDDNCYEMTTIKNICELELDYNQYQNLVDPRAINLIQQMLNKDTQKRISIKSALMHEWLNQKIDRLELITPQINNYRFQRHSICTCSNSSFNTPSNKVNYKRGSLFQQRDLFKKHLNLERIPDDVYQNDSNNLEDSSAFQDAC